LAARIKLLDRDNRALTSLFEKLGVDVPPSSTSAALKPTATPAKAKTASDGAPDKAAADAGDISLTKGKSIFDEVPDSPSAAILGVTPQKIIRPSTPADLIGAVVSGLDEHGNLQSGLAIDIAPMKFFEKKAWFPAITLILLFSRSVIGHQISRLWFSRRFSGFLNLRCGFDSRRGQVSEKQNT
jgi:hypothetical protein